MQKPTYRPPFILRVLACLGLIVLAIYTGDNRLVSLVFAISALDALIYREFYWLYEKITPEKRPIWYWTEVALSLGAAVFFFFFEN
jgi:hypothetical protein